MLPHPARPIEPALSVQTPAAKRGNAARGAAGTDITSFVPPLAPSPPPGTPPTVHTRIKTDGSNLSQSIFPGSAERKTEELQPGSFGSILHGENTRDSSGRAYHLREPFNPARAAQRLVSSRAAQAAERQEAQEDIGHRDDDDWPETGHGHGEHPPKPEHTQANTIRRAAVTTCTAAALGAAYGLTRTAEGWPQIDNSPGSVLDPAASLLGMYVWIWLAWIPVLAGAAGYAVCQWLPSQRANPRQAWTGPLSAGAAVVTALWLWAAQSGNPAAAFWLAALGVGVGLAGIHLSNTRPAGSRSEVMTADLPSAVFLGTSTAALFAGLGSWLTDMDTDVAGWGPEPWALIALVAAVIGITTICMTDRGHLAVALTAVASLTAMGFARLFTEQLSMPVAAGAFVGGFLILVSAGSRRHQVDHAQRRRERERLKSEASAPAAGEVPEAVRT